MVSVGAVVDGVPGTRAKLKHRVALEVEQSSLCWHGAVHHTELQPFGAPRHVIDGALLG